MKWTKDCKTCVSIYANGYEAWVEEKYLNLFGNGTDYDTWLHPGSHVLKLTETGTQNVIWAIAGMISMHDVEVKKYENFN